MARPNVLLIHTDQQRWDALGANGNDEIHTPNLDRFAADAVNFTRCFVQNPVCAPSRASYLTGRYPSELGIYDNGIPLPTDVPTLPELLGQSGYHTANVGKLHFRPNANRDHDRPYPDDYGFDHLELSDAPGNYRDAYRAWAEAVHPDEVEDEDGVDQLSIGIHDVRETWNELTGRSESIAHPERASTYDSVPFRASDEATHSTFVAERTIEYLDRTREPFCCVSGFFAPHPPLYVPQTYLDLYDREDLSLPDYPPELEAGCDDTFSDEALRAARHGYYALVSEVDHHVGRILDALEAEGLAENTVVVVTSDHGEYLGDHCRFAKGLPGRDAVSRVPLLIRWPEGVANPGRETDGIVELVDLVPTLLDCAEMQVPPRLPGRSLRPALRDDGFEGRDSALLEGDGIRNLRTDRYRYVRERDGTESLFDFADDYPEYRDHAGDPDYADVLADLRQRLIDRMMAVPQQRPREWAW